MTLKRTLLSLALLVATSPACAQVVCLGASNTAGPTVSPPAAYPAQLEAMLRAKGYTGHVANEGISGDTTAGMLSRLDRAIPAGTRLVVLQAGGNEARAGLAYQRQGNIDEMVNRLKARQVAVIVMDERMLGALIKQGFGSDGLHLTEEGYRRLAAQLLPQVAQALGLPAN